MRLSRTLSRAATNSADVIDPLPPLESSGCLMVLSTRFNVISAEPTLAATSRLDLSAALLQEASSRQEKRTKMNGLKKRNTTLLLGSGLTNAESSVLSCRFAFIAIFSSEERHNVQAL